MKEKHVFDDLDALRQYSETEDQKMATQTKKARIRYIGSSFEWLKQVLPYIKTRNQLLVALLLYRRMKVCGSKTFSFWNNELEQLGIDRYAKSRVLAKLEQAGIIKTGGKPGYPTKVRILK